MRYSQLFGKTNKEAPQDADSINARLLIQGGFINQLAAGIYSYLPLGLRVLKKIQNIVREEMNALGAQEVYLPALQPKEPWQKTGRWDTIDVMFKLKGHGDKDYCLGLTHEDVITPLVQQFAKSYKDYPFFLYQIQDKFRNEARAKSGLLRGREFSMKDMYSFHLSEEDRAEFYQKAAEAYRRVFERIGIKAIYTEASGGDFSKDSHEFQTPTESGEDIIFHCESCEYAWNKEISEVKDGDDCPKGCGGKVKELKAIEVGNIFPLGTKFSDAIKLKIKDDQGQDQPVVMGSYGIGMSRVMGAVVEVSHDDKGIIWPKSVAPAAVHLVTLNSKDSAVQGRIKDIAESLENDLEAAGIEIIWDDRDKAPGEKFADADLIGVPLRLVISEKSLAEDSVEWKERAVDESQLVSVNEIMNKVQSFVREK
ncbi:aminoacyl--tRNA ligase-related protein [Patescibacteria group bacterium]